MMILRRATPLMVAGLAVIAGCTGSDSPDVGVGPTTSAAAVGTSPASSSTLPLPVEIPRFTEVAAAAGFDAVQSELVDPTEFAEMVSAVSVVDVDGDGDLDVHLPRPGLPNLMLVNDGTGVFVDRAEALGLDTIGSGVGSAWGDLDGDGDLDVVESGDDGVRVLLFDGAVYGAVGGRGLDLPTGEAVADGTIAHSGATVADVDTDGDLDVFTRQWRAVKADAILAGTLDPEALIDIEEANGNRLFLNDGTGEFTDVTGDWFSEPGSDGFEIWMASSFGASFLDSDQDGWPDLFLAGDHGSSRLYRNVDGEGFADLTVERAVGTDEFGMGSSLEDLDGDRRPDWFVTSIYGTSSACLLCDGNRLFLSGNDPYEDATDRFGFREGYWGWGTDFADFDNDADLDLVQTNGYFRADPVFLDDPTLVWLQTESGWRESATDTGLVHTGQGRGLVNFDMDDDGDLDVLIVNHGEAPSLFRNDSPARSWLRVRLHQAGANASATGAMVEVVPVDDAEPLRRYLLASGPYMTQRPSEVHFGLGDLVGPAVSVADVVVTWPDGVEEHFGPQPVDRIIDLERTAPLRDPDAPAHDGDANS